MYRSMNIGIVDKHIAMVLLVLLDTKQFARKSYADDVQFFIVHLSSTILNRQLVRTHKRYTDL